MRIRRLFPLAIAMAMVAAAYPAAPAGAITLTEINSRMKDLRARLIRVGNAVDEAGSQLEVANQAIAQHAAALQAANKRLGELRQGISDRIALLYMMGSQQMDVLASSTSPTVFADRLTYLEQLGHGQQREVEDIRAMRVHARIESRLLHSAQARASAQRSTLLSAQSQLQSAYNEMSKLQGFLQSFSPRGAGRGSRGGRGIVCPIPGGAPVSNDFGAPRPGGPHTGNDIHAPEGTPMQAVLPGTIVDLPGGWAGLGILMRDPLGNEWLYAHGSARYVHVGQHVEQGEIIGRVGNTGHSWGAHLHFEYHPNGGAPADPYPILSRIC